MVNNERILCTKTTWTPPTYTMFSTLFFSIKFNVFYFRQNILNNEGTLFTFQILINPRARRILVLLKTSAFWIILMVPFQPWILKLDWRYQIAWMDTVHCPRNIVSCFLDLRKYSMIILKKFLCFFLLSFAEIHKDSHVSRNALCFMVDLISLFIPFFASMNFSASFSPFLREPLCNVQQLEDSHIGYAWKLWIIYN